MFVCVGVQREVYTIQDDLSRHTLQGKKGDRSTSVAPTLEKNLRSCSCRWEREPRRGRPLDVSVEFGPPSFLVVRFLLSCPRFTFFVCFSFFSVLFSFIGQSSP